MKVGLEKRVASLEAEQPTKRIRYGWRWEGGEDIPEIGPDEELIVIQWVGSGGDTDDAA